METNSGLQINKFKARQLYEKAKRLEIENARTGRYDDKEMVKLLTRSILKLAEEDQAENGGEEEAT